MERTYNRFKINLRMPQKFNWSRAVSGLKEKNREISREGISHE
jgi:hypothetical protein